MQLECPAIRRCDEFVEAIGIQPSGQRRDGHGQALGPCLEHKDFFGVGCQQSLRAVEVDLQGGYLDIGCTGLGQAGQE